MPSVAACVVCCSFVTATAARTQRRCARRPRGVVWVVPETEGSSNYYLPDPYRASKWHYRQTKHISGTKKEHKPKLLSPDIFRWGRGLPREGVGAKKFSMPLKTREIKLFWRDIPGFCRDIPETIGDFYGGGGG